MRIFTKTLGLATLLAAAAIANADDATSAAPATPAASEANPAASSATPAAADTAPAASSTTPTTPSSAPTASSATPAASGSGQAAAAPSGQAAQDADNDDHGSHKYYVGVGLFDTILDVNGEVVTGWGNFAGRIGRSKDHGNEFLTTFGWHRPLEGDDGNASGYYYGVFGGQVADENVGGQPFRLWGGGVDLGYHWLTTNTRSIVSVGLGAHQKKSFNGVFLNAEPTLYFNVSIAIGR